MTHPAGSRPGPYEILLTAAGLAILGFLAERLLRWMEWRGWIEYRPTYSGQITSGPVGPAFLASRRRGADGASIDPRR
jgi:hypothetical protein